MEAFPVEAFKQHGQLRWCQMDFSVADGGPDKVTAIQAFDEQAKAILIGPQYFNHVTAVSAEDDRRTGHR